MAKAFLGSRRNRSPIMSRRRAPGSADDEHLGKAVRVWAQLPQEGDPAACPRPRRFIVGELRIGHVLIARKELIDKEPKVVKDVIRVFFESEAEIETNFEEAAKVTIGKYYKTDMTSLLAAAKAQPPGVDIRNKRDFMFGRAQSMKELNYISKDPDAGFVNFKLLEEVIAENPDLYKKVKVKSP